MPRNRRFKPVTSGVKQNELYATPGGGEARFDFVGDIVGARANLIMDADGKGYTAVFVIPRSFLELTITKNSSLAADIEVLLSGQGARGLQTVSRNYLFSPSTTQTSMVDDVPTEARLYPQYWGTAEIQ